VTHTCHAPGCNRLVPPRMWGCATHWFALPQKIRDAIWREYQSGQEISKRASWRYMAVQRLALAYSVFRPGDEKAVLETLRYVGDAMRYAKEAVATGQGDPLEGLIPKDWPPRPKPKLKSVKKARARSKTL
jgi:hypothetical protein